MLDLNKWCGVKYNDKIINFQWVEIASCPNPELNGEYTFTQILKSNCSFDTVIDVGASNSIYPEIFPEHKVFLFDDHNIDINLKNVIAINKYIGFEKDQVKLDDYIKNEYKYFIKIDVNGFEKNVIDTISSSKKESIVCLQFEYDCMWRDTNSKLQEVIDLLPFDEFYAIEHNGLRKIVSFDDDYMYRNIICGNLDFDDIDAQMRQKSLLSPEQTIWDGNNPIVDDYIKKVIWWSKNEIRKYTEQRRRLTNFPLSTFIINSTIIKKPHILLRILNKIKRIFS